MQVTIFSVPGSSYSIWPRLQPPCQLQTSSLRILSRPWFKTKQHNIKQCKTTPNPCRISQEKNCLRIDSLLVILRLVCCTYINVKWIDRTFLNQSYFLASQLLTEATKYFYFSSKTCNLVLEMYLTKLFSVITCWFTITTNIIIIIASTIKLL